MADPPLIASFVYEPLPQRVLFDREHTSAVAMELERLECHRAVVVTTPGHGAHGRQLAHALGERCAGVFAGAVVHTPVGVTENALAEIGRLRADVLIALGGGSAIGLGKAIASRTDLPQIAVPTTYAGSEATPILGETAGGRKTMRRDLKILPEVVVYDVDLTLTLDPATSAASGLNAIAHAVEALYARERNPVLSWLAGQGIEAMIAALPRVRQDPHDRAARVSALYGAWACGTCLAMAGMALHHKLCHVLGGMFNLPHAATHAVVLPHAIGYNERAAASELAPVSRLLEAPNAAMGLWGLAASLGAPTTLRELEVPQDDLGHVVDELMRNPYWNPQPLVPTELLALLETAYLGGPPGRA